MNKIAVVYKSEYGSTDKYAKWISEELCATLIEQSKAKLEDLLNYDVIIYGGGLYASGINGVSLITQNFSKLKEKKLIVFTVGLSSTQDEKIFTPVKNHNFSPEMQLKIKFFHFRGGMDYKKLSFIHKGMMAMLKKSVEKKGIKDDEQKLFIETYGKSVDFSDKETIAPLIEYVNKLITEENVNA